MRAIKKFFMTIVLLLIVALAIIIAGGWGKYTQAIKILPLETAAENIKSQPAFMAIDDIPEIFINAMVAVEDRRFYKHSGMDYIGIARAVKKNVEEKALLEGGSSITQQLAKNIYFMGDDTLSRKIAEIFVSFLELNI